jgi:hypothetical protein
MAGVVPRLSLSDMPDLTNGHWWKQRVPWSINRVNNKLIFVK